MSVNASESPGQMTTQADTIHTHMQYIHNAHAYISIVNVWYNTHMLHAYHCFIRCGTIHTCYVRTIENVG